jgi:hypothetical protein
VTQAPKAVAAAGYSGTPLAAKLGIKPGMRVFVEGAPEQYRQLLAPLPDGVAFARTLSASIRLAHLFAIERGRLRDALGRYRSKLAPDAVLWVSWPKKSAKVATDITEDTIRELALPLGFVDVKVCAVDEIWSALKLVVRKGLR